MGRYIKWDDVVNRYKKFGDMVSGSNEAQETYLQYAEAYVDAGLAAKFAVPFSSNNVVVKDLCIDVAFAKAIMFTEDAKAAKIMAHVSSYIGALMDGSMTMVLSGGVTVAQTGEPVYSENMDYIPVFGKGDVTDFRVDSAQLYDEEQDRDY